MANKNKIYLYWAFLMAVSVGLFVPAGIFANESSRPKYRHAQVSRSDKDIMIPRELVRKIEDLFRKKQAESKVQVDPIESGGRIPRKFLSLEIDMDGAALSEPLKFELPRGGGVIDFKDFLSDKGGSLTVRFRAGWEESEKLNVKDLKVYFLSNSRRRQAHKREYGSGCDKYMDVSNFYRKILSQEGVELISHDGLHVSALAGTFYFVYPTAESLYLASLTFEDSRFPERQCRENVMPQSAKR